MLILDSGLLLGHPVYQRSNVARPELSCECIAAACHEHHRKSPNSSHFLLDDGCKPVWILKFHDITRIQCT